MHLSRAPLEHRAQSFAVHDTEDILGIVGRRGLKRVWVLRVALPVCVVILAIILAVLLIGSFDLARALGLFESMGAPTPLVP